MDLQPRNSVAQQLVRENVIFAALFPIMTLMPLLGSPVNLGIDPSARYLFTLNYMRNGEAWLTGLLAIFTFKANLVADLAGRQRQASSPLRTLGLHGELPPQDPSPTHTNVRCMKLHRLLPFLSCLLDGCFDHAISAHSNRTGLAAYPCTWLLPRNLREKPVCLCFSCARAFSL